MMETGDRIDYVGFFCFVLHLLLAARFPLVVLQLHF